VRRGKQDPLGRLVQLAQPARLVKLEAPEPQVRREALAVQVRLGPLDQLGHRETLETQAGPEEQEEQETQATLEAQDQQQATQPCKESSTPAAAFLLVRQE
jgi:hypothetical protein